MRKLKRIIFGVTMLSVMCAMGCGSTETHTKHTDVELQTKVIKATEKATESQRAENETVKATSAETIKETESNTVKETQKQTQSVEGTKSYKDMSVKERIETLEILGNKVTLPVKYGDLPDVITAKEGIKMPGTCMVSMFYNNDKQVGRLVFNDVVGDSMEFVDLTNGHDEELIYGVSFDDINAFKLAGVTSVSTKQQVIDMWGVPTNYDGYEIEYLSTVDGMTYEIRLGWMTVDGVESMCLCTIFVYETGKRPI